MVCAVEKDTFVYMLSLFFFHLRMLLTTKWLCSDYFCTPTYYAISFIFKALPLAYNFVDSQRLLARVRQAAQMFQQRGALDAANELRQGVDRIGALTQMALSPGLLENPGAEIHLNVLFDIPSFIDEMAR